MKKNIRLSLLFILAGVLMSACLSDDTTTTEYTNETAITAFSLGTLSRTMHTTASDGGDSTYTTTVSGSTYKFNIDQRAGLIYNTDSLLKWTNPKKILCTITAYGSSAVGYVKPNNDTIYAYSSTDTLDFSEPVEFRVYAADGSGAYRKYMASVNIHQEEGDSVRWQTLGAVAPQSKLLKAYSNNGSIFLASSDSTATTLYCTPDTDGKTWTPLTANIPLDGMAYNNIVVFRGDFFVLTGGGLYRSSDGASWQAVSTPGLDNLIAAGSSEMYGISGKKIMLSADGGLTWKADSMADSQEFLPQKDFSYAVREVKSNAQTERIIIMGNRNDASEHGVAMIWSKVVENRANSDAYAWTRTLPHDMAVALDHQDGVSMVGYDDGLLALTGDYFYYSMDDGLVWKTNTSLYVKPDDFAAYDPSQFTMTCDDNEWLWFVAENGKVWKARLNRLAWEE